jgi:hypothetical protein
LRKLTDNEMDIYRRPFLSPGEDRRPTLTWPRQIPIENEPKDVVEKTKEEAKAKAEKAKEEAKAKVEKAEREVKAEMTEKKAIARAETAKREAMKEKRQKHFWEFWK